VPLRLRCRNSLRKRVAHHVAVPAQALKKTRRPEHIAGAGQSLGDLWRRRLRRISINEPANLDRVGGAQFAHVRKGAIADVERAGDGVRERGDVFEQRPRLLEERRCAAHCVGCYLNEGIVPWQAGLVSRRVVQSPWLKDFRLVQRPQCAAASSEIHRVKQSVGCPPSRLIGARHRR
jgi:hypothetical protein